MDDEHDDAKSWQISSEEEFDGEEEGEFIEEEEEEEEEEEVEESLIDEIEKRRFGGNDDDDAAAEEGAFVDEGGEFSNGDERKDEDEDDAYEEGEYDEGSYEEGEYEEGEAYEDDYDGTGDDVGVPPLSPLRSDAADPAPAPQKQRRPSQGSVSNAAAAAAPKRSWLSWMWGGGGESSSTTSAAPLVSHHTGAGEEYDDEGSYYSDDSPQRGVEVADRHRRTKYAPVARSARWELQPGQQQQQQAGGGGGGSSSDMAAVDEAQLPSWMRSALAERQQMDDAAREMEATMRRMGSKLAALEDECRNHTAGQLVREAERASQATRIENYTRELAASLSALDASKAETRAAEAAATKAQVANTALTKRLARVECSLGALGKELTARLADVVAGDGAVARVAPAELHEEHHLGIDVLMRTLAHAPSSAEGQRTARHIRALLARLEERSRKAPSSKKVGVVGGKKAKARGGRRKKVKTVVRRGSGGSSGSRGSGGSRGNS